MKSEKGLLPVVQKSLMQNLVLSASSRDLALHLIFIHIFILLLQMGYLKPKTSLFSSTKYFLLLMTLLSHKTAFANECSNFLPDVAGSEKMKSKKCSIMKTAAFPLTPR